MSFTKGSSDTSTQALDVLNQIDTLLASDSWVDLATVSDATYDYHLWQSLAANNGVMDFVIAIRIAQSGTGSLSFGVFEEFDGIDQVRRPGVFTDFNDDVWCWVPSHGGDWSFGGFSSADYDAFTHPAWWSLFGPELYYGVSIDCDDDSLIEYFIKTDVDFFVLGTYLHAVDTSQAIYCGMGNDLLPDSQRAPVILPIDGFGGTTTRARYHSTWETVFYDDGSGTNTNFWGTGMSGAFQMYAMRVPFNLVGEVMATGEDDRYSPTFLGPHGSPVSLMWRSQPNIYDGTDYKGVPLPLVEILTFKDLAAFDTNTSFVGMGDEIASGTDTYVYLIGNYWVKK